MMCNKQKIYFKFLYSFCFVLFFGEGRRKNLKVSLLFGGSFKDIKLNKAAQIISLISPQIKNYFNRILTESHPLKYYLGSS